MAEAAATIEQPTARLSPVDRIAAVLGRVASVPADILVGELRQDEDFFYELVGRALAFAIQHDARIHDIPQKNELESRTYRPYLEVIKEGVERYQAEHPDPPVFWTKSQNALNEKVLRQVLLSKISKVEATRFSNKKLAGRPFLEAVWWSNKEGTYYLLQELVMKRLGDASPALSQKVQQAESDGTRLFTLEMKGSWGSWDEQNALSQQFLRVREHIEHVSREYYDNGPVSASHILSFLLSEHSGDLTKSLYETASFLKFMSRGKEDVSWFQQFILDEYSPLLPYQFLSDDPRIPYRDRFVQIMGKIAESLFPFVGGTSDAYRDIEALNQIGKPYHAAHMVALLDVFPPEAIAFMTGMEYLKYGHLHGASKALADLAVIRQLPEIEKYLRSFAPPEKVYVGSSAGK